MTFLSEDDLEIESLNWFKEIGYLYIHGKDLAPDGISSERKDFREIFLIERIKTTLKTLNPDISEKVIEAKTHIKTHFLSFF